MPIAAGAAAAAAAAGAAAGGGTVASAETVGVGFEIAGAARAAG